MKTDLFYYTGTGNSLWTARTLAQKLGDAGKKTQRYERYRHPEVKLADMVSVSTPQEEREATAKSV